MSVLNGPIDAGLAQPAMAPFPPTEPVSESHPPPPICRPVGQPLIDTEGPFDQESGMSIRLPRRRSVLIASGLTLFPLLAVSGCKDAALPPSTQLSPPHQTAELPANPWLSLVEEPRLSDWKFIDFGGRDAFQKQAGQLTVEAGYPLAGFVFGGAFPTSNYELELEAQKIDGTDFFCLVTFPVGEQSCSLVLGGWGGTVTGISCVNQKDASDNLTTSARKYEYQRWYRVSIRVQAERLLCRVDDQLIVDLPLQDVQLSVRTDIAATEPLGICSFETAAAWKNIRYKSLP